MRCEDTARKEEEGITRNYISKGGREIACGHTCGEEDEEGQRQMRQRGQVGVCVMSG